MPPVIEILRCRTAAIGLGLGVSALACGCVSTAPEYQSRGLPPTPAIVQSLNAADARRPDDESGIAADPILKRLIAAADAGNQDLIALAYRLKSARARTSLAESARLPKATLAAEYEKSKEQIPGFGEGRVSVSRYQAGLDASWELDVFGRIERRVDIETASAEALAYDADDLRMSLFAELAQTWVRYAGAGERVCLAQRSLELQRSTVDLVKRRLRLGRGTDLDLIVAEQAVSSTQSDLQQLTAERYALRQKMGTLVGGQSEIDAILGPEEAVLDNQPVKIASFQPDFRDAGRFLVRRPDLRAAERRVAVEVARLGLAESAWIPRISISGFIGLLSGTPSAFTSESGQAWSIGPTIYWDGLNVKRLRSQIDAASSDASAALADYDARIQRAVEDASVSASWLSHSRDALETNITSSELAAHSIHLAQIQYASGRVDFIRVIDAQRQSIAALNRVVESKTAVNVYSIATMKAVGYLPFAPADPPSSSEFGEGPKSERQTSAP